MGYTPTPATKKPCFELPDITVFKWFIAGKEILFGYNNQEFKFLKLEYKSGIFRPYIKLQVGTSYYTYKFKGATQKEYEKVKEDLYQHLAELALLENL